MPRLFVALRPPPAIRQGLLAAAGEVPGARWQDDDQLHITLRFIGAVDDAVADDLMLAIERATMPMPPLRIVGVGQFAHKGRTDTLWAGVAPADALARLHRKVDAACVRAGLPPERRAYHPHVTLARLSRGAGHGAALDRWLVERAALASPAFTATHLVLYESVLGRDGAAYSPVARWPLPVADGQMDRGDGRCDR